LADENRNAESSHGHRIWPLYILPFDHRASFEKGLFGFSAPLTAEQTARIAARNVWKIEGLDRRDDCAAVW